MFLFTSLALKEKKPQTKNPPPPAPQYNDYNNFNVKLDVRYVFVTC